MLGTGWDAAALAPVREAFVAMVEETFEDITVAAALHGSARWAAPDLTGY
nr:hypothetical protein [Sphingomonas bacterium]